MKSAKENILKLPDMCYSVLLMDRSLIQIKAGETGYRPLNPLFVKKGLKIFDMEDTNALANKLNSDMGISIAQRSAMENGSMFGWETPGADPDLYKNSKF